jgi:hypothetical protein
MLCLPQILFRPGAMSSHVIVIGCAGIFHFVDRFLYVVMDFLQIVPVVNLVGNRDSGSKRQTGRKSGNSIAFFIDRFPPKIVDYSGHVRTLAILADRDHHVKMK